MNVLRSSFIYSFFTSISRVFGFIRDILIANFLGTGVTADIFFIAFRLPNTFRRIFSEGALNSAFVPIYTKLIKDMKTQINKEFANGCWKASNNFNKIITKANIYKIRICPKNALVEATPISGPQCIGKTKLESLAIELSITLTTAHVFILFFLQRSKAA